MIRRIPRFHAAAWTFLTGALAAGFALSGSPAGAEVPPEQPFGVADDTANAIKETWEDWLNAFERGDAETLAVLFTEDGVWAANTGDVLRGRAAIREGVNGWSARQAMFLEGLGFPADTRMDVEEEVLRFRSAGDTVYRLSRFMVLVEPSRCALDAGHILGVWRRQADGQWRVESLLGNRDRRPPEQACGRTQSAPE